MLLSGDVRHVVNMVLNDNRGQRLTDALIVGIESAVFYYCEKVSCANKTTKTLDPKPEENKEVEIIDAGTPAS